MAAFFTTCIRIFSLSVLFLASLGFADVEHKGTLGVDSGDPSAESEPRSNPTTGREISSSGVIPGIRSVGAGAGATVSRAAVRKPSFRRTGYQGYRPPVRQNLNLRPVSVMATATNALVTPNGPPGKGMGGTDVTKGLVSKINVADPTPIKADTKAPAAADSKDGKGGEYNYLAGYSKLFGAMAPGGVSADKNNSAAVAAAVAKPAPAPANATAAAPSGGTSPMASGGGGGGGGAQQVATAPPAAQAVQAPAQQVAQQKQQRQQNVNNPDALGLVALGQNIERQNQQLVALATRNRELARTAAEEQLRAGRPVSPDILRQMAATDPDGLADLVIISAGTNGTIPPELLATVRGIPGFLARVQGRPGGSGVTAIGPNTTTD